MTAIEIREDIVRKFREGQEITLRVPDCNKNSTHAVKVKILTFNPNSVLTENNGYKESFTYWDIKNMTDPPKPRKIIIPEKYGRHK